MRGDAALTVALAAGALGALQPKVNAALAGEVGHVIGAALVNFAGAFATVVLVVAARPTTRRRLLDVRHWPVPRWTMTAGLGGAVIVLAGAAAVDDLGVAVFSIAFFGGQIVFSLVVDRVGIGPGGVRLLDARRVEGAALAIAAIAIAQLGRQVGEVTPVLVVLAVAAGAALALQSAFNGRIASTLGDPMAATAVNVVVGLVAMLLVGGLLVGSGTVDLASWPRQPWLYSGGLLGVTIVLALATATAALGVLRSTIATLAAQLVAAFAVDWVALGVPPTAGAVAGAGLVVTAVVRLRR